MHMARIGQSLSPHYVDRYSSDGASLILPRPDTWLLREHGPPAI